MTPLTTRLQVEFDQVNKLSLIRAKGRLTDESLAELYEASRRYSTATKAKVGIVDLSSVTEFVLSTEFIRHRARQKPATADPRIIVAPQTYAFGLFRMLQLLGEPANPLLQIVHTLDEVFAGLGIPAPHFETLGWTALVGDETRERRLHRTVAAFGFAHLLKRNGFRP
jgi:hypothetical protein